MFWFSRTKVYEKNKGFHDPDFTGVEPVGKFGARCKSVAIGKILIFSRSSSAKLITRDHESIIGGLPLLALESLDTLLSLIASTTTGSSPNSPRSSSSEYICLCYSIFFKFKLLFIKYVLKAMEIRHTNFIRHYRIFVT